MSHSRKIPPLGLIPPNKFARLAGTLGQTPRGQDVPVVVPRESEAAERRRRSEAEKGRQLAALAEWRKSREEADHA